MVDTPLQALARRAPQRPAIVLDDDPTGTQTLRDVSVLTAWDSDAIAGHLHEGVVFLSTNSRSRDEAAAVAITHDAAVTAVGAAQLARRQISIVSRGDSTLRGHFPAETRAVAEAMGAPGARVLLAPYFGEGGRITVDDVHWLERDGVRLPVGETEFARDVIFGYRSSNLVEWVAEKYEAAATSVPPVASISLDLIRSGGPDAVSRELLALPPAGVAVVNAELDADIEAVALGAVIAEDAGLPIVARTAASYVRARAGRAVAAPLTKDELHAEGPGLIVVGSHVEATTTQLRHLLASPRGNAIETTELGIDPIIDGGTAADAAIARCAAVLERAATAERIGLVSTERARRDLDLEGARAVSAALVAVVDAVRARPGWVIAKGGITSFDLASRALGMREARVVGQVLPGVPVWIGSAGSRWPGVPLVVFPGNVGPADALTRAVDLLAG